MSNEINNQEVEGTPSAAQTITPNQNDTTNNNSVSPANEAAGNIVDASGDVTATPTPEQLQAEINRLNALMSSTLDDASASVINVPDTVNDTSAGTPSTAPGLDTANHVDNTSLSAASIPAYIIEFRQAFAVASANQSFLNDRKKVEKATAAMKMPNPEDRVRAQLLVHTEKRMYADAAKRAEKGEPFVPPTKAQINAKVEEGVIVWRSKQN